MPKPRLYCLLLLGFLVISPLTSIIGQSLQEKGVKFLRSHSTNPLVFNNSIRFSEIKLSNSQLILQAEDPPCFIIFQLVKNDTLVVAYSASNIYCTPDSVQAVAQEMLGQIGRTHYKKLLKSGFESGRIPVGPLVKSKWSQDEWYNRYCPYEIRCKAGQNTYAGCIAVALSQIIRYYGKWNDFIIDAEHSYLGKKISAYSTGYNWASIIDAPINYELEVCRILADIGIQCKLNYGISSTHQSTGIARKAINEMGYTNAFKAEQHQYENEEWLNMIYQSIENYSPVFVAGGGHAFVCDGYDSDGRLHFNLGWGGFADGYYDHNCIYDNICAREAIFEIMPEPEFGRPVNLRIESIKEHDMICWTPPDDWEDPLGYKLYYSDDDYIEINDTCIPVHDLKAGTWGIMISALYGEGESVWSGPVWIYNRGFDVMINDTALIRGLNIPNEGPEILQGNVMMTEGVLADIKILKIEGQLTDPGQLNSLYRLQELDLNAGNLDKADLAFIEMLNNLQTLRISNLDQENMPDLKMLPKLVELELDSCRLDNLGSISGMDQLVVLKIENCRINNFSVPPGLDNLEILCLNNLLGIPSSFNISAFENLRKLEINDCGINCIESDLQLDKLTCLDVVNNNLDNYDFLQKMPVIIDVCLQGNALNSLDIHADHKYLRRLDLSNNAIDRISIAYDLPSLKELDLSYNGFEEFPGIFKHMPNLEALHISNNKLSKLPQMKLPYLEHMDLSCNELNNLNGIDINESLKTLNIRGNRISDLYPLIKGNFYQNLFELDISDNPLSKESYLEALPELANGINKLSAPPDYEPRSPCYPVPRSPARISNREINLSWFDEAWEDVKYYLYFGSGDSIKLEKDDLDYPGTELRLYKGQKYQWQVAAKYSDTIFYSGLYELITTTELEIPYREDFELFETGDRITAASTNWRLTHGINDSYQDAEISIAKSGQGHGKSLHISDYSNISIDLNHLSVPSTLVIHYDQYIIAGKTSHICLNNMQGLNIDLYSDGYSSTVYLDGAFLSEFNADLNSWNHFRISIQGLNNRVFICCNDSLIMNKKWVFNNDSGWIESLVFSSDKPSSVSGAMSFESYIDNLFIYDANDRTGIDEIKPDEEDFNIYPNPADQFICFSGMPVNKDYEVEIIDSRGRRVLAKFIPAFSGEFTLSLQNLDPGVYFYRLLDQKTNLKNGKLLLVR